MARVTAGHSAKQGSSVSPVRGNHNVLVIT